MVKRTTTILSLGIAAILAVGSSVQAELPKTITLENKKPVPARLLQSTNATPLQPVPDPISYSQPVPMHSASNSNMVYSGSPQMMNGGMPVSYQGGYGGYPQTYAPLYPSPTPNVPRNIGGTYVTAHALSPHEMLYPHQYKSMYGPFYWKVRGSWVVTPFGVRSHDRWELQGTEVTVKYRDHYKLFSGFHPPWSKKH